MKNFVCPLLLGFSIPLQLLGYSETCTQGSTDGYVAGATLSLPLLLVVCVLQISRALKAQDHRYTVSVVADLFSTALGMLLLCINFRLVAGVLLDGHTACGEFYSELGSAGSEDYLVATVYGILPLVIFILAGVSGVRSMLRNTEEKPPKSVG